MFHNSASAEVDLFLSDDLKNLRLFLLKRFWFFMPIKVGRNQWINLPGREIKYCIYKIINRPDHPSFKRRGNFFMQFLIHRQSLSWRLWGRGAILRPCALLQLNGLSPNGLWKGSLFFLLLPNGGGGGSIGALIITSEIELSSWIMLTSGRTYFFLDILFRDFNSKEMFSNLVQK